MSPGKKKEPARKLRVLALVHPDLVPPDKADPEELPGKPWKTEYDVVRTLEALGHEVQVLGVGDELGGIRNAMHDFKPHIAFNLLEGFDDAGAPRLRPAKRPITLRHLLTHTAGFGYEIWDQALVRYVKATGMPSIFTGKLASLRLPLGRW